MLGEGKTSGMFSSSLSRCTWLSWKVLVFQDIVSVQTASEVIAQGLICSQRLSVLRMKIGLLAPAQAVRALLGWETLEKQWRRRQHKTFFGSVLCCFEPISLTCYLKMWTLHLCEHLRNVIYWSTGSVTILLVCNNVQKTKKMKCL